MKEKRFNVGDKITYKSNKDCVSSSGNKGFYYIGGVDQCGFIGKITGYEHYNKEMGCWMIRVTSGNPRCDVFCMLECEFLEYDKPVVTNELFPIY